MLGLFIGTPELIFIIFIVVLVFGTDKVPVIARQLSGIMRNIRQATKEIQYEITKEDNKAPARTQEHEESVKKDGLG